MTAGDGAPFAGRFVSGCLFMATIPLMEPVYKGSQGPVFFAAGFRPFFLFAAVQAAVMLPPRHGNQATKRSLALFSS